MTAFLLALPFFLFLGHWGLIEPTDARYAEIAREMLFSGDWVTPHLLGLPYFQKPPLSFWLIASGLKIFGINEWGARFFQALAAFGTALLIYRTHRRAAWILAASPLFWIHSRLLSADMFLTFFVTAAWVMGYGLRVTGHDQRPLDSKVDTRAPCPVTLSFAVALAFLTKGPVALLWTVVPMMLLNSPLLWRERVRVRGSFNDSNVTLIPAFSLQGRRGLLIAIAATVLALSWYLLVSFRNPGLLSYFLDVQLWKRVTSVETFHRGGPIYYYLPLLMIAFLPYIRYWKSALKILWADKTLLFWAGWPLVVLSLVASKLPGYLLPALVPFAIAIGRAIPEEDRNWGWGGALSLTILFTFWLGAPRWFPQLPTIREHARVLKQHWSPGDRVTVLSRKLYGLTFYTGLIPLSETRALNPAYLILKPEFIFCEMDQVHSLPRAVKRSIQLLYPSNFPLKSTPTPLILLSTFKSAERGAFK